MVRSHVIPTEQQGAVLHKKGVATDIMHDDTLLIHGSVVVNMLPNLVS